MRIIPGLTSTVKDNILPFVEALRRSEVRAIALFPTTLTARERLSLYSELESVENLIIPHVHLRTDMDEGEMQYLVDRYRTEVFNIHPVASHHPFGPVPPRFSQRVFVENSNCRVEDEELDAVRGICPDFSHLESANGLGWTDYTETTLRQLRQYHIGCCHVSAIRVDDQNGWSGGSDHHRYLSLSDLDYMTGYTEFLPRRWVSLELENSLAEQIQAVAYLQRIFGESTSDAEYCQNPDQT